MKELSIFSISTILAVAICLIGTIVYYSYFNLLVNFPGYIWIGLSLVPGIVFISKSSVPTLSKTIIAAAFIASSIAIAALISVLVCCKYFGVCL